MDLDTSIIDYMKIRADFAKAVTSALGTQCFALAVFFCAYGLMAGGFAYSGSYAMLRLVIISISILVSILLCIFNCMVWVKYRKVIAKTPDSIGIRQSSETVEEAYRIARPVLIYKITIACLALFVGGLAYIMLTIFLSRTVVAGVYGRIVVSLCCAFAIMYGGPAIDRIAAYRSALLQTHSLLSTKKNGYLAGMTIAACLPLSICAWYVLRFYTGKSTIAWIVFPMVALFGVAFVYLAGWAKNSYADAPDA